MNKERKNKSSSKIPFPIAKLLHYWQDTIDTLWFFPAVIVVGFLLLAILGIELDLRLIGEDFDKWRPVFGAQEEGSRSMLSAIASSMITVLGVLFSITIVTLSLAANQYTPRILRNFMKDRITQSVMGVFAGIYVYCLLVLRTIRGSGEGFVPSISVTFSVLLAIVGIAFLILFIHHISSSIQASNITASVAEETNESIDNFFPCDLKRENESDEYFASDENIAPNTLVWIPINAWKSGYIQRITYDSINAYCIDNNLFIRIDNLVGDFVVDGMPIAFISANDVEVEKAKDRIKRFFVIGRYRTIEQDPAFGIRILVDIALKALSPGINDTTTAINCIDYLTSILFKLGTRRIESYKQLENEKSKVFFKQHSYEDFVMTAFDQIRINANGRIDVLLPLLKMIEDLHSNVKSRNRQNVLLKQLNLITETAKITLKNSYEIELFENTKNKILQSGGFN